MDIEPGKLRLQKNQQNEMVYFQSGDDINVAIIREKQVKAGSRKKRMDLINSVNPGWKDLFDEYFG
jgi:putative endonuclease